MLVNSLDLEYGRNPDIGTLKKERGGVFFECCTGKEKFLRYINEVLFEMTKTAFKDTYIGVTTPTELQKEFYTCRKMYYDK